VQYVQVNALQAWKIAAFLVAFFSSFFSHSYSLNIDYSKIEGKPPRVTTVFVGNCQQIGLSGLDVSSCIEAYYEHYNSTLFTAGLHYDIENDYQLLYNTPDTKMYTISGTAKYPSESDPRGYKDSGYNMASQFWIKVTESETRSCPPENFIEFTFGNDVDGDGETDTCYHPNDIKFLVEEQNELDKNEDYCKHLVLDAGNNTAASACYVAYNGANCSVSQKTSGDFTYYQGTSNNPTGCESGTEPIFDSSGTGSDKDECVYSNGSNYCKASEEKHCKDVQGTKICDDGCIDDGANVYCDTSKHPDVGEGESDYFNDNGTCSVIAASSTKGFCEDMGGTWDETQNATEADCPIGTGSCSVATSGHCGACLDSGGVWTPDNAIPVSEEAKATVEVAALTKKSNEKLAQIENATRKGSEALISTTKSGNQKVVAAIEELTKIVKDKPSGGGAAQEERETYTTTNSAIDKSKLSSLFDDASKALLQADITQLKTDMTAFINTARSEATSLMSIDVPSSSGYEVRNLTLTHGTFDMSLSRFDYFFKLLAGPIMLICSMMAAFVLLGNKN